MGEIVACANQKGGVGKTTTVVNVASYLAQAGRQVLVVDLDPQGNASSGLGIDRDELMGSAYDLLVGARPPAELECPSQVDGLRVIPSGRELTGVEVELVTLEGRERKLQRALRSELDRFDFVFLDCPPSLGLITVNALTAAHSVLIPIQCEYYALEGLSQLMSTIDLIRDNLNPGLRVNGILLTMYDGRTTLSADVSAEVRRHMAGQVFDAVVPRSVRLAEAPGYGRPITLYSPESPGAQAYRQLADEILEREAQMSRDSAPSAAWAGAA
ncbi:AAA family ATPase [soil metagenome]